MKHWIIILLICFAQQSFSQAPSYDLLNQEEQILFRLEQDITNLENELVERGINPKKDYRYIQMSAELKAQKTKVKSLRKDYARYKKSVGRKGDPTPPMQEQVVIYNSPKVITPEQEDRLKEAQRLQKEEIKELTKQKKELEKQREAYYDKATSLNQDPMSFPEIRNLDRELMKISEQINYLSTTPVTLEALNKPNSGNDGSGRLFAPEPAMPRSVNQTSPATNTPRSQPQPEYTYSQAQTPNYQPVTQSPAAQQGLSKSEQKQLEKLAKDRRKEEQKAMMLQIRELENKRSEFAKNSKSVGQDPSKNYKVREVDEQIQLLNQQLEELKTKPISIQQEINSLPPIQPEPSTQVVSQSKPQQSIEPSPKPEPKEPVIEQVYEAPVQQPLSPVVEDNQLLNQEKNQQKEQEKNIKKQKKDLEKQRKQLVNISESLGENPLNNPQVQEIDRRLELLNNQLNNVENKPVSIQEKILTPAPTTAQVPEQPQKVSVETPQQVKQQATPQIVELDEPVQQPVSPKVVVIDEPVQQPVPPRIPVIDEPVYQEPEPVVYVPEPVQDFSEAAPVIQDTIPVAPPIKPASDATSKPRSISNQVNNQPANPSYQPPVQALPNPQTVITAEQEQLLKEAKKQRKDEIKAIKKKKKELEGQRKSIARNVESMQQNPLDNPQVQAIDEKIASLNNQLYYLDNQPVSIQDKLLTPAPSVANQQINTMPAASPHPQYTGAVPNMVSPGVVAAVTLPEIGLDLMLFPKFATAVPKEYNLYLNYVAKQLQDNPSLRLQIEAYTDDSEKSKVSYQITTQMANATAQEFVNRGVNPARLVVNANGSKSPIGDNKTYFGQIRNRRVELSFVAN